jgi:hypothetical protein
MSSKYRFLMAASGMPQWIGRLTFLLAFTGFAVCQAGIIPVTSRAALAANDYVDWGEIGAPGNSYVPNPLSVTSADGSTVMVTKPAEQFHFLVQAAPGQSFPPYWGGNFAPGDNLLTTEGPGDATNPGPMTIQFATPVYGAGAQIQTNDGGAFTARISALDNKGDILGYVTESGTSNGNRNGSAIFLGILSDTANIAAVRFSIDQFPPGQDTDFAINRVGIVVPEPSTLALFGIGALSLLAYAWRRRTKATV